MFCDEFRYAGRRLARAARRFRIDRTGNVAIIFGFCLVPLLGCTGLAFDFGRVLIARYACQTAADAAALYASGVAKTLIQNSDGSPSSVTAAFAEAKSRAEALFDAEAARYAKVAMSRSVTLSQKGLAITADSSFTISIGATLAKLFGVQTFNASGAAQSAASLPAYTNVYMALDVSQSMGLASTTAGAKSLYQAVVASERAFGSSSPTGCVFGCHVVQNGKKSLYTYQAIAKTNNVKLRIDVLRDSVIQTITTAQSDAFSANTTNYRIALYTFGLSSSNGNTYLLSQIQSLTNNWTTLNTSANNIDLGPNNGGGTGDTYFNGPLNDLRAKIVSGGDGTSLATAKQYLFLITDGLEDIAGSCTSGHCTKAFDPSFCTAFKNSSITVAVIYTTYLPILNNPTDGSTALNGDYVALAQPYLQQIPTNLKACASPGWYAEASDGPSISAALAAMFGQTTQQAALTR